MAQQDRINVGIVGAAGRGGSFPEALEANGAHLKAICDVKPEALERAASQFGVEEKYTDYDQMLDRAGLDAVVIGTPMQFHATQSIAALNRNIHVLCEVTAGVSVEECRSLVAATTQSKAIYMMAENYTYIKTNVLIRELVRQGLFGEVFYAEGEYLHELKGLNEITKWRRHWQTGIAGITYGTHSLGPILQWMPGDRIVRVCCETTGSHHRDPRGEPYAADSATMLGKTARGALIKIRLDMISDRPHAMTNYQLQGTDGAYESHRGGPHDMHKVWLRQLSKEQRWMDLMSLADIESMAERFLPELWRHPPEAALRAGHGGGDYFEVNDFIRSIRGEIKCPIGIHESMDMTLPGLMSQQSAQNEGAWVAVPDSRTW